MNARMRALRLIAATAAGVLLSAGLLAGCAQSAATTSDTGASGLVNSVTDQEGIVFTLYVGLVDKDAGAQLLDMQRAKELSAPLVSAAAGGGYTVIEAQGGYADDDGNPVENDTLVYMGVHISEQEALMLIDDIKASLGIESVYVTCERVGYGIFGGQVSS